MDKRELARKLIINVSNKIESKNIERNYNGKCKYCGSPTIDGKHGWGWSACKNYIRPKEGDND